MNNDLRPINTIPNFKRFCMTIGELPTSYLETMTYYEMLVWFTEYMKNTIIPTINNNGLAIEELQNKYIELKSYVDNYFTNLDVQEEINNKLDQMVQDGTLQEIIASYLNSKAIFGFDNVASMKSSTNLIDGSYAKTLGYYEKNDGGGATYKITNTKSLTEYQEQLNSGLYATLIIENNIVIPEQIGCIGDNETDNFNNFKTLFSKFNNIKFLNGKTYKINIVGSDEQTYPIELISNQTIDFNNSKIESYDLSGNYGSLFTIINKENIIIKNGILHSNRGITTEYRHGINIQSSSNILIENMKIDNFSGDSITLNEYETSKIPSSNITINNCVCENSYRNNISLIACNSVIISNSQLNKASGTSPQAGIDLECNRPYQYLKNININNCIFNENTTRGIFIDYHNNPSDLEINVDNCVFNNNSRDIAINENETANDTKGYIKFNNITSNNTKVSFAYFKGHTIENKLPIYFNNIVINGGNSTNATGITGSTFAFDVINNPIVDIFIKNVKILNSSFIRTIWGIKLKNIEYKGDAPDNFVIDGTYSENIKINTENEILISGNPTIPSSSFVFNVNYGKSNIASSNSTLTFGTLPKGLKIKITNYSPTYKVTINGTDLNPLEIGYWDTTNNVLLK